MKRVFTLLAASVAIALSATGSVAPLEGNTSATGDYVRSNGSHMVINAVKHKNGITTGTVHFTSALGATILVEVDELVVIDNSAYIFGVVVYSSNNPALVGNRSYHRVVDNGERAGSLPDRASAFNNPFTPLPDPIGALSATSAILEGNIQVRP